MNINVYGKPTHQKLKNWSQIIKKPKYVNLVVVVKYDPDVIGG
jgi:hypothetical protein